MQIFEHKTFLFFTSTICKKANAAKSAPCTHMRSICYAEHGRADEWYRQAVDTHAKRCHLIRICAGKFLCTVDPRVRLHLLQCGECMYLKTECPRVYTSAEGAQRYCRTRLISTVHVLILKGNDALKTVGTYIAHPCTYYVEQAVGAHFTLNTRTAKKKQSKNAPDRNGNRQEKITLYSGLIVPSRHIP